MFSWLLTMVASWTWSAGYQVAESGVDIDRMQEEKLLIMPNHQSTADVPLLMTIFSSRIGFCNKLMWIMDRVFKFTNFGVISWLHDDFFILAGKTNREVSLEELRSHLATVFLPKERNYLVLFPEGGFLRKRKAVSQAYAKKKDLPMLEHCTLPRTGALDVIMSVLGPKDEKEGKEEASQPKDVITKIVDVTVAFPEGRPLDLQAIVTGWRKPCITHVHYRVFDTKDLPITSEELFSWMVRLYQEKEELLDTFYKTGKFPHDLFEPDSLPPKIITHDPLRFLVLHIFFLSSTYIFYTAVASVLGIFY